MLSRRWTRRSPTFCSDVATQHPLVSARLLLEPVRERDADEVWPQYGQAGNWTYFPALRPQSLADVRARFARWERGYAGDEAQIWENWLCRLKAGGTAIGTAQATIVPDHRAATIAYGVFPAHRRRGYAAEAARAIVAHLRTEHATRCVRAEVDPRNVASWRLLESLGFRRSARSAAEPAEYLYELCAD